MTQKSFYGLKEWDIVSKQQTSALVVKCKGIVLNNLIFSIRIVVLISVVLAAAIHINLF